MDSDPGSRAVRPGAFGVGGVDPFEGSFVWTRSLFTNQYQVKPYRCSRRVASTIECIDLDCASNLMFVLICLTAPQLLNQNPNFFANWRYKPTLHNLYKPLC